MELKAYYDTIKAIVDTVAFSELWRGFSPLRFALYRGNECVLGGAECVRPEDFVANTAVLHEGEWTAIWNALEDADPEIMASKLIHEMFHGFQQRCGEARFPDELEALRRYEYTPEGLSARAEENRLIAALTERFDADGFARLGRIMAYRRRAFPYEAGYEAAVMQIEGSARMVELEALRRISAAKYRESLASSVSALRDTGRLMPARIISYEAGALLIMLMRAHTALDTESFAGDTFAGAFAAAAGGEEPVPADAAVAALIRERRGSAEAAARKAEAAGRVAAEGCFELTGVNVYNAVRAGDTILSDCFAAYSDGGGEKVLYGDFAVQLDGEGRVRRILYRE